MKPYTPLVPCLLLLLTTDPLGGCGSPAPGVSFIAEAIGAMPYVRASGPARASTVADHQTIRDFFKHECHMPDTKENFCAAGVDVTANGGYNEYKFTSTTLLGLIYHAEMYGRNVYDHPGYSTCGVANAKPATVTAASFTGGVDPDRYVLDFFGLLDCVGSFDFQGHESHVAYSRSADNLSYASISARQHVPFSGGGHDQTDIFQQYLSMHGKTPSVLAFNHAGVSSMYVRAVLIANLEKHKFAVKYQTRPDRWLAAVGVGGVDRASGKPNPGFYRASADSLPNGARDLCVNNADGSIGADGAGCDAAGIPWTGWTSSDAIAEYLELSATDKSRVASFLALFAGPTALGDGTYPTADSDADAFFPSDIH